MSIEWIGCDLIGVYTNLIGEGRALLEVGWSVFAPPPPRGSNQPEYVYPLIEFHEIRT